MNDLAVLTKHIPAMNIQEIEKVSQLESICLSAPQVDISTTHLIHAGMYARTVMVPAGVVITGVLIKVATILIIQGNVIVHIGEKSVNLQGYNVISADANRKQAFVAIEDTYITMILPSQALSVEEAEEEFTDNSDALLSRKNIVETGK